MTLQDVPEIWSLSVSGEASLLGIPFQSSLHLYWFLASVGILLLSSTTFALAMRHRIHRFDPVDVLRTALYLQAAAALLAFLMRQNVSIVWNLFLAGLYGIMVSIASRRKKTVRP